jgi:hypothetical protein
LGAIVGIAIVFAFGLVGSDAGLALLIGIPCVVIIAVLLYTEDICLIILYAIHYILMMPTVVNILPFYAITQTDSINWGKSPGQDVSDVINLY